MCAPPEAFQKKNQMTQYAPRSDRLDFNVGIVFDVFGKEIIVFHEKGAVLRKLSKTTHMTHMLSRAHRLDCDAVFFVIFTGEWKISI